MPGRGRIALKGITAFIATVTLGVVTATAFVMGAGWLLSVSLKARSESRSVMALAAPPSNKLTSAALSAGEIAMPALAVADLWPPDTQPAAAAPAQNAAAKLALVAIAKPASKPDKPADEFYTGSLGTYSSTPDSSEVASFAPASAADGLPTSDDAQQPPLPRAPPQAGTQVASLGPVDSPGGTSDDDARSRTAIYDITARAVYLPNGERLEAHSGLGDFMDDPRHVHRKMRGATPPNTYRLTLRESLFHGVRAIRMTPEDDDKMYGRDGILAHTYMLGPNGQSNGCVSFRDYQKFLHAFLRGEVDRMVVVSRLDKPPRFYARVRSKGEGKTL